MKKSLFFLPLVFGLAACSEKDVVDLDGNNGNKDVDVSYLAVNIVSSQTAGSRAEEGDFSVGNANENYVNAIRFYFFDKNGGAAIVKANGATFYDAKAEEISNDFSAKDEQGNPIHKPGDNSNLESTVSAVIVIESPKGDDKPYYVAAVINPTIDTPILKEGEGIDKLKDWTEDYTEHLDNEFVMSSTAYKANLKTYDANNTLNTGAEGDYTLVEVYDNIQTTRLAALDKKATIHVERVLAKVSVEVGIEVKEEINGEDAYLVGHVGKASADVTDENAIYVKFLGWNTTATRKKSRLIKKTEVSYWNDHTDRSGNFETWSISWNDLSNHRSYWAVNPKNSTDWSDDYHYGNFGEGIAKNEKGEEIKNSDEFSANAMKFGKDEKDYVYLQENAGSFNSSLENDELSKIIVAAQLVDYKGNPLDIVEWGGDIYKKNDELLQKIAETMDLWVVDGDKGTKDEPSTGRYTQITNENIQLIHPTSGPTSSKNTVQRYYMKVKLDPNKRYAYRLYDKNAQAWVFDEGDENGYAYEYTDVNKNSNDKYPFSTSISGLGYIKYWNNGYTYYWVDIKHFGGDKEKGEAGIGKYGVVRNHWYQYKFTSVVGLGVPVPDPDEVIYPETPHDDELFYLAAEVEILSWKLVLHQTEQLGW